MMVAGGAALEIPRLQIACRFRFSDFKSADLRGDSEVDGNACR
jgi:hypothetical protein